MEKVTTEGQVFKCLECENQVKVPADSKQGDFIECEFCGIEYEVLEVTPGGEFVLQIVEEEK